MPLEIYQEQYGESKYWCAPLHSKVWMGFREASKELERMKGANQQWCTISSRGGGGSNPSRTLCFPLLAVTKGNSPRKTPDLYWYQTRALDWPTTRRFVQQKAPVKSSSLPQHPLNHHSPITLPDKTRAATGSPGESHKCWSVWERDLRFIELRFELMTPIVKRYILVGRGSDLKSHKLYKEKEV